MNNGFIGTGISILFYLLLAMVMPLVYLYKVSRGQYPFKAQFVFRHFLFGLMIALTIKLVVSLIAKEVGLTGTSHIKDVLNLVAWAASVMLIIWFIMPYLVKIYHQVFGASVTPLPEPIIHLPLAAALFQNGSSDGVVDGILSPSQWKKLKRKLYGSNSKNRPLNPRKPKFLDNHKNGRSDKERREYLKHLTKK